MATVAIILIVIWGKGGYKSQAPVVATKWEPPETEHEDYKYLKALKPNDKISLYTKWPAHHMKLLANNCSVYGNMPSKKLLTVRYQFLGEPTYEVTLHYRDIVDGFADLNPHVVASLCPHAPRHTNFQ